MVRLILSLFTAAALTLTASAASRGDYPDISHDELKAALASGRVTLLDVNGSRSYQNGHIPGAIDFAAAKDNLASHLPADKSALIVAYCGSKTCKAYRKGADAVAALGFTNIKHYPGGLAGWKEKNEPLARR